MLAKAVVTVADILCLGLMFVKTVGADAMAAVFGVFVVAVAEETVPPVVQVAINGEVTQLIRFWLNPLVIVVPVLRWLASASLDDGVISWRPTDTERL